MAFTRYLIRFSYIGTGFRGAQKINIASSQNETIEGNIELGLQHFKYIQGSLISSSRTDAGVHALNASAQFDIAPWKSNFPSELSILKHLNVYFHRNNLSISVNQVRKVPPTFNARYQAISRTYLYRLAINTCMSDEKRYQRLPIEEWKRIAYYRYHKFDVDKFRDAMKLFEGLHDFETFKKYVSTNPWKHSVREINSVDIYRGSPMSTTYNKDRYNSFEFWDIKINGKAFVHNQVRRMIGTGIAVAIGKIDLSEINLMLTIPSKNSWNIKIPIAPSYGLYLCDVEYNEDDLIYEKQIDNTSLNLD